MNNKTQIERYLEQVATIDKSGFHAWVLETGRSFTPADVVEISPLMLEHVDPQPKGCFFNSYRGAGIKDLSYFEGFYLPTFKGGPLFPMEHAFNVRKSTGSILDFTAQAGKIDVCEWFGVELSPVDVAIYLLEGGRTPLLSYFIEKVK